LYPQLSRRRRDLAADEPCPDHAGSSTRASRPSDPVGFLERPQGEDAGEVVSRHREPPIPTAGRDQDLVEGNTISVLEPHDPAAHVHAHRSRTQPHVHAVVRVPGGRTQQRAVGRGFAAQIFLRQGRALVGRVLLRSDHDHIALEAFRPEGRRFDEPNRHGKWLACPTDGPSLLLHFGMTGDLVWSRDEPDRHRWDRLILVFDDGELRYRNMRKLGGAWLAPSPAKANAILGGLGPDALALTQREFLERLRRRRGGTKSALMDQRFIAGVGNIIADETLWQ